MLRVPEQLAAPPAGDVAPLERAFGVLQGDAPPLARDGHGGAVPAGQERQPPVGEGQPSSRAAGPGRQAEAFEGDDAVGDPLGRDAHQPGQLLEGDPGPVGDEVEGALLYGLEKDRQHVVGDVPPRTVDGEVGGRVGALRFRLYWKLSARPHPVEGVAQVDLGADLRRTPYPVARPRQHRKAFHGEQGRNVGGGEQPSGVPEPHLVGHEDQHRFGHRPVAQPPEPPGEARPVGGQSLPDDADGPPVGKGHGGVEGDGAVPAEPDGECQAGDGGGDALDGCQGVEALHQAAPPLGGDGTGAHQLVGGHALLVREPAQP